MRWTLLLIVTAGLGATPARAGWIDAPGVNLPVCTISNHQLYATIVDDGAGGAIVAWQDNRSGYDIYAQHVLASGELDPVWPLGGRALCTAIGAQTTPKIVADGTGGAIVTWQDNRSGIDIYAQHVLSSGAVDPAWPADGRALCTAVGAQSSPQIVTDDAGGAIVTWQDGRNGSNSDVYAQHVRFSGTVDPAWPADGRALCTAIDYQYLQEIAVDGAGGAIVTWQDLRSGGGWDIYAQHVQVSGTVDPAWPVNGRALCTAINFQETPKIVADGTGGAIVIWRDYRSGSRYDIYAQHLQALGTVDPAWPADGRALRTSPENDLVPTIVADGAGGAITVWRLNSSGAIGAQHVLASGVVDPSWPTAGCGIVAVGEVLPMAVTDGAGGAIVAWQDSRRGEYDIYAQHVLASGVPDPSWPPESRALSAAPSLQLTPAIATDGAGGAIVAWHDLRSGDYDIYAQRVTANGHFGDISPSPEIAHVRDTPNDQGGRIKLSWNASPLDAAPYDLIGMYTVWRSVPPTIAQSALASGARLVGPDMPLLIETTRSLRTTPSASGVIYWEFVGTQHARRFAGYSMVVSTTGDSVASSNPYTLFMVSAGSVNGIYLDSAPDSGYSVDNLAPLQASPFAATMQAGGVALHWGLNREPDLSGYTIHRGSGPDFVPGPTTFVASKPDTGYLDQAGPGGGYYKIAAVDIHGNLSPYATVSVDLPTATLMSLASMEVSAGRVRLVWQAPAYPGASWALQRRARNADWVSIGEANSDSRGFVSFDDTEVRPGERYDYRVRGVIDGQEVLSPEVAVTVPEATFALESVSPNPLVGPNLVVWFTLPEAAPARLEVFDVSGRLIASHEVGALDAGRHSVQFASSRVGTGIHFVRLVQGTHAASRRVASMR